MSEPTRAQLFAMLDKPAEVIGEGPVLLVIATPYEGIRLQRYPDAARASVDWLNYTGPGCAWLFEVGRELAFEELPRPVDAKDGTTDPIPRSGRKTISMPQEE